MNASMAAAMLWLPPFSRTSRAFRVGSLNSIHHAPRVTVSPGCAGFQESALGAASATTSLNAGGISTAGRTYFGPTAHADTASAPASDTRCASSRTDEVAIIMDEPARRRRLSPGEAAPPLRRSAIDPGA